MKFGCSLFQTQKTGNLPKTIQNMFYTDNLRMYVGWDRMFLQYFYRPQTKFGKVMFLHLSVSHSVHGGCACSRGGTCSWGVPALGSLPAPGGCLLRGRVPAPGEGVCSGGCLLQGGCLVETPRDGYCCGRYASYWNAFLFSTKFLFGGGGESQ